MSLRTTISGLLGAARHPEGSPMRATRNGALLAESDDTLVVEGNHYFPADRLRWDHFRPSESHTMCPWKGQASYYHVTVDSEVNPDAAWFYPAPSPAAGRIKDRVAFWRGVRMERVIAAGETTGEGA